MTSDDSSLPVKLPAVGVAAHVAHVEEDEKAVRKLKFTDDRINAQLEKVIDSVPADAPFAVVATAFKEHDGEIKTKLAVYLRKQDPILGGDLSFGGFIAGDVKRPLDTIGAEVRWVGR